MQATSFRSPQRRKHTTFRWLEYYIVWGFLAAPSSASVYHTNVSSLQRTKTYSKYFGRNAGTPSQRPSCWRNRCARKIHGCRRCCTRSATVKRPGRCIVSSTASQHFIPDLGCPQQTDLDAVTRLALNFLRSGEACSPTPCSIKNMRAGS